MRTRSRSRGSPKTRKLYDPPADTVPRRGPACVRLVNILNSPLEWDIVFGEFEDIVFGEFGDGAFFPEQRE